MIREKGKKAQEQKYKILVSTPKKAQEEMVGFAVIVGIVAVVILFLLVIYLRNSGTDVENSYEAESFVQAVLQYTTECESNYENLSIEKIIIACSNNERCLDSEKNACEILNSSLIGILEENWGVGEESPVKGYEMRIKLDEREIFYSEKGNKTRDYKGAIQILPRKTEILFRVYY